MGITAMAKVKNNTVTTTVDGVVMAPAVTNTSKPNPLMKLLGHRMSLRDLLEASTLPGEFDAVVAIYCRKLELDATQKKAISDAFTVQLPFRLREVEVEVETEKK